MHFATLCVTRPTTHLRIDLKRLVLCEAARLSLTGVRMIAEQNSDDEEAR
jgi:hypothetical protein